MSEARITLDKQDAVAVVRLARPERLNALDLEMLRALDETCAAIETDSSIRAAVIIGEGKAFSAGGDIKAWAGMGAGEFGHQWVRFGHRVFERLAGLRVPLIAALNGHALGGGLEIAACADLRIAETQAKIGLPETSLGMVPGWSGTQRLVRRFGIQPVRRMALCGEMLSADEALRLGIVDRVVGTGEAFAAAFAQAQGIAARGPAATETVKLMLAAAEGEGAPAAVEALGSILAAKTADLREGVSAFGEKRAAQFQGGW